MKIFNNLPKLSSEDTANSIVTYESMDNTNATSWTDVDVIESGEKLFDSITCFEVPESGFLEMCIKD